MKRRVLHVIDHTSDGGAQVVVRYLAQTLKERFLADVAVLGRSGQFSRVYRSLGLSVRELGRGHSRWNPAGLVDLLKVIRKERYDLIHTHLFKSNILGTLAARHAGCRTILHDHTGVYPQSMQHYLRNGMVRRTYLAAYRYALTRSDKVLVLTPEMLHAYVRCYSIAPDKIAVVPNAVDVHQFGAMGAARRPGTLRVELGLPPETRLVIMVGRLDPEKGWRTFLDVAARVDRERRHPSAFLVVGSGAEEQLLRQYARDQQIRRVFFMGYRNDIPALLQQADVFLLTSRREPFGIVLLEAMAAGCPLVTTRSGGPETILTHEVDGLLAEVDDVAGLSDYVLRLLDDREQARRLAAQARQTVAERYSLRAIGEQVAGIYTEVMEQ